MKEICSLLLKLSTIRRNKRNNVTNVTPLLRCYAVTQVYYYFHYLKQYSIYHNVNY